MPSWLFALLFGAHLALRCTLVMGVRLALQATYSAPHDTAELTASVNGSSESIMRISVPYWACLTSWKGWPSSWATAVAMSRSGTCGCEAQHESACKRTQLKLQRHCLGQANTCEG